MCKYPHFDYNISTYFSYQFSHFWKTQRKNPNIKRNPSVFLFLLGFFLCSSSCSSFTLLFLLDFLECLSNTTHSPPGHLNVQHTKTKQVFVFIWIPTQTIHPLPKTPNEEKTLHSHTHEELELDLLVYCVCTNALLILFVDRLLVRSFGVHSFVRACSFMALSVSWEYARIHHLDTNTTKWCWLWLTTKRLHNNNKLTDTHPHNHKHPPTDRPIPGVLLFCYLCYLSIYVWGMMIVWKKIKQ